MDNKTLRERQLAEFEDAELFVLEGGRTVVEQEARVAALRSNGHDVTRAEETLEVFRTTHKQQIAHREMLLRELSEKAFLFNQ